jgi:hypothetical protein
MYVPTTVVGASRITIHFGFVKVDRQIFFEVSFEDWFITRIDKSNLIAVEFDYWWEFEKLLDDP